MPPTLEYEQYKFIPLDVFDAIKQECSNAIQRFEGDATKIIVNCNYPLSWMQTKRLSKQLTREFDNPIIVVSKLNNDDYEKYKDIITHDNIIPGKYCQFNAQIIMFLTDADNNTIYEFAKCKDMFNKDRLHDYYALKFPDEDDVRGGIHKTDYSHTFSSYTYRAITYVNNDKRVVTIFSSQPLDIGTDYLVRGLCWIAPDKKNSKAMPSQEIYVFADSCTLSRSLLELDDKFFNKFKGICHEDFVNSCAFPFHNSVSHYKELIFLAVFAIRSETIPLNIFIIGPPGCTKSGFLKRIAAISRDELLDSGSSTLKGLLPSFFAKSPSAGAMATARYFVILNEFFEIVRQVNQTDNAHDILSKLKNLLEGGLVPARSGTGGMNVKVRGSMFFVSNWVSLGRDSRASRVDDLYARMDSALLDRFLIYPVPFEDQNVLVNQHTIPIKERIKSFASTYKTKDITKDRDIELIENLPSDFPISTLELRTILSFKSQLTPKLAYEAQSYLIEQGKEIQSKYTYEKYTRAQDFMLLIASAYGLETALRLGKLNKDSSEFEISLENVKNASAFYKLVLETHSGKRFRDTMRKEEFIESSATKPQKFILEILKRAFEDASRISMKIEDVISTFKGAYKEVDWKLAVLPLIQLKLIAWSETDLIYLNPKLENEVLNALSVGGAQAMLYESELAANHLLEYSRIERKFYSRWKLITPTKPSEQIQKLIIESIKIPKTPSELIAILGEQYLNDIHYLHISQEIVLDSEGKYNAKGE